MGGVASGLIQAGVQIGLFITQWTFVLEILWISTIIVPFTIMSISFYLLDWLILDKLTTFLISGNWNNVDQMIITATSPLIIMLYVAGFFGLLFAIVFFINYFGRTILDINISEIIKKLFWIFGFILLIIAIPFFLIFFSVFIKFCTVIVQKMFSNTNYMNQILVNNSNLSISINILNSFTMGQSINKNYWDELWSQITDQNALSIKDNLYNAYENILKIQRDLNWDNLIYEMQISIDNPQALKNIFNRPDLMKNLNQIYSYSLIIKSSFETLNNNSNIPNDLYLNITGCLSGNLDSIVTVSDFSNALNQTILNGSIYQNIQIDPTTNEIIETKNIGYMLYTAVTGIPVNSINGIWDNITFISALFRSNGIVNLTKSIMLGGAVAIASAKGIMQLVTMLIYRWLWILASVPYGAIATVRSLNDNWSIFKLYFRETLTSFVSLFVIALNLQIMNLLISIINNGFKNGEIIINGIDANNTALSIVFIILVIISIYATVAITQKVLEIFNNSTIAKDNGINALTNEYNSFKNNKNQRVNNSNFARREMSKQINRKIMDNQKKSSNTNLKPNNKIKHSTKKGK